MRITANFSEWELRVSRNHPELVPALDEIPGAVLAHAVIGAHIMMQPLRDVAGWIDVLSWIRLEELNAATPGAKPDSDHRRGLCVDFRPRLITPAEFWRLAVAGELGEARFDKLNFYPERRSFHGAIRPLEDGEQRMLLYLDWRRVN